ncbi:SAM-dependent methyltransferase [Streptomyces sp. NPDC055078]
MPDHPDVPLPGRQASTARLYGAYQGGGEEKHAYPVDVSLAEAVKGLGLDTQLIARQNRLFHNRAVQAVAELGIDQVLDIGAGLPAQTGTNTHEIMQKAIPTARVVYADNEPFVLRHAEALLHSGPDGATACVQADLRRPDIILAEARRTLDFDRPVAVLLIALLHFLPDDDAPYDLVEQLVTALAPGSVLVLSHVTDDYNPTVVRRAEALLGEGGIRSQARSRDAILRFFTGVGLLPPGLVPVHQWRPADPDPGASPAQDIPASDIHNYGGIGLKPASRPDGAPSEQTERAEPPETGPGNTEHPGPAQPAPRPSHGGTAVAAFGGDIGDREGPALREPLDALADEPQDAVVLDLTGFEFLDPTGLGALLGLRHRLRENGRTLHATGADSVRRILRITGLTDAVPPQRDLPQALAATTPKGPARALGTFEPSAVRRAG